MKVFPSLQNSGHRARAIQLGLLVNCWCDGNAAVAWLHSF
ncbi:hypothetical protein AVDCRST_MAG84-236 [uncultured Microcoleus sp.]|uniref:Uncharacterized protein n=1 Tax=uncultured Microcoleus sp. TaxID=259945 RepID=A0A6J4KEA5_9CYAN|nr:hypothetical protein AVDCRST_MAG84-236 [uncultured Microcoleus sp.]